MKLVATADVFLTNFRPSGRKKLRIDVDDVRAVNPNIIYVRGSAAGQQGSEAERGDYNLTSCWAHAGIASNVSPDSLGFPVTMPGPASATCSADSRSRAPSAPRSSTVGAPRRPSRSTARCSRLAPGRWAARSPGRTPSNRRSTPAHPRPRPNPLVNSYRTADDRYVTLVMLESDRFWPELTTALGTPELITDERFDTHAKRGKNNVEAIAELPSWRSSAAPGRRSSTRSRWSRTRRSSRRLRRRP